MQILYTGVLTDKAFGLRVETICNIQQRKAIYEGRLMGFGFRVSGFRFSGKAYVEQGAGGKV